MSNTINDLIQHILYGDIDEVPLRILDDDCPDDITYHQFDTEQQTRLAVAATIKKWFELTNIQDK